MDRNPSFQKTESKQSKQSRPTRPDARQHTASTLRLRPAMSRLATAATNGTGGTAEQGGYSLAGNHNQQDRGGPNRDTYVAQGYRDLNPQYEKQQDEPTFSLGSNLPRTVRGWQGKKQNQAKNDKANAPAVDPGEKGQGEPAPQLQDADHRRKGRGDSQQSEQPLQSPDMPTSSQEGGMKMQTASARNRDGDAGVVGHQAVYSPGPEGSEDDTTLAPEDDDMSGASMPFNRWALVRAKLQDGLGEWLGTTIYVMLGICSNLAVATGEAQHPGIYQNMYWGWGFAVMLGIYIAGGSSGAHLNPAISIPLWIYRGFPARKLPTFIFFQVLGAFTGAILAIAIYRDAILYAEGGLNPSASGVSIYTQPQDYVRPATAFFTEFLGTAILVCSILALGDDSNSPPGAGMHAFIIGLLVTALLMTFGSNTGGCLNPARDFGPRLAAMAMGYPTSIFSAYHNWWIWGGWIAPISGGLCGGAVYDVCVFKGGESPINFSPQRWQGKANEGKLDFLQMFRQHTQAKNLEHAMEKGEVENGGE